MLDLPELDQGNRRYSDLCLCLLPLPPALSREYVRPPLTEWLDTN